MAKAIWNGTVIAESDEIIKIFDTFFFPSQSIKKEYFQASKTKTTTFWNGNASYYSLMIDGKEYHDAAWYYDASGESITSIKDHVAFWKDVSIKLQ